MENLHILRAEVRRLSVIFHLMLFPEESQGSTSYILEELATTIARNIYNLFSQHKRNPTIDQVLEEPSTFFFHHISYSVFVTFIHGCRIRSTQRTASNPKAKGIESI